MSANPDLDDAVMDATNVGQQAIRNLVMDLDDAGCRARFLIRDRDGKFPALMDEILAEAHIRTVLTAIRDAAGADTLFDHCYSSCYPAPSVWGGPRGRCKG